MFDADKEWGKAMSNVYLVRYLQDYGKSRAGEIRTLILAAADRIGELSARINELSARIEELEGRE